ncbi:MAG: Eco29kI family restriction endonuclease [Caulobacteraceae bacterium]|nr:Eco29kI family restriction endonuclease [Caulobacteraceae bacterium]
MARSPDKLALDALGAALAQVLSTVDAEATPTIVRRVRAGLALHAAAVERARGVTDTIDTPRSSFDPSDPKTVGRMVSIALLAQPMVPLGSVRPAYGSGVYAIYYAGDHPLYARISGTETPIYVGKADPANGDASTVREQGPKLTARLIEHAGTIATAQRYALEAGLPDGLSPIRLEDFSCRRLVCATNAQLVAERHLIRTFWPVWNSDTKACWGMSKHGDAAKTRRNKRSPWDVVHPGRPWALDTELKDNATAEEIGLRINAILDEYPPRTNHAALLQEMLMAFRQDDGAPPVESTISPLRDVNGPTEDEAGGPDDD